MSKNFARENTFPLTWPEHFPRTKTRESSRFDTTLAQALRNVEEELLRFAKDSKKKISELVISSNYSLSDQRPEDPGVAIYFTWDGERNCIPVDRYRKIECNLQAVYYCINAKRALLRHGGLNLVKAAFRGYTALPNPGTIDWRRILDFNGESYEHCKSKYLAMIRQAHPDKPGGSHERTAEINQAWEMAKQELGSGSA